jgi:hypothetical protein
VDAHAGWEQESIMPITEDLLRVIREAAAATPTFNERLGPGADKGTGATRNFVRTVNTP